MLLIYGLIFLVSDAFLAVLGIFLGKKSAKTQYIEPSFRSEFLFNLNMVASVIISVMNMFLYIVLVDNEQRPMVYLSLVVLLLVVFVSTSAMAFMLSEHRERSLKRR